MYRTKGDESTGTHRAYQKVAYKDGLAQLALKVLKEDLDDEQLDIRMENGEELSADVTGNAKGAWEPTLVQKMLMLCLDFLNVLSRNHRAVQSLVFNEFVPLMRAKSTQSPIVSVKVAQACCHTFSVPFFQMRVREALIETVCGHVQAFMIGNRSGSLAEEDTVGMKKNGKNMYLAEYLELMKCMCTKHEGNEEANSSITENQSHIITQLMKHGELGKFLEDSQRLRNAIRTVSGSKRVPAGSSSKLRLTKEILATPNWFGFEYVSLSHVAPQPAYQGLRCELDPGFNRVGLHNTNTSTDTAPVTTPHTALSGTSNFLQYVARVQISTSKVSAKKYCRWTTCSVYWSWTGGESKAAKAVKAAFLLTKRSHAKVNLLISRVNLLK